MTAPPSPDTLRLSNGVVELHVPTGYGPRVSHYGFTGGPNVFGDAAGAERETPLGLWRAFGGHRLWVAPERFPETYLLDDDPPAIEAFERRLVVRRPRPTATGLALALELVLDPHGTGVEVRHEIANESNAPQRVAPWAITVVRPGGDALIPNPEPAPQREALLPARTLALWRYTDLADPRFGFGPHFLRLRCDPGRSAPNKIGAAGERGWFAYVAERTGFVVRTGYDPSAEYPDLGCSLEVYTEGAFCEVETLGPLVTLAPGGIVRHVERWSLIADLDTADETSLARAFAEHLAT